MDSFGGQLVSGEAARDYALAGNATMTLVSTKTEKRFTFRIQVSDDGSVYFVGLLTGPNNTDDYSYLGVVRAEDLRYYHGKKSGISADAPGAKAFAWAWPYLAVRQMPPGAEVWHEGRCGRCGRKLTTPESVASGIGPVCILKE